MNRDIQREAWSRFRATRFRQLRTFDDDQVKRLSEAAGSGGQWLDLLQRLIIVEKEQRAAELARG